MSEPMGKTESDITQVEESTLDITILPNRGYRLNKEGYYNIYVKDLEFPVVPDWIIIKYSGLMGFCAEEMVYEYDTPDFDNAEMIWVVREHIEYCYGVEYCDISKVFKYLAKYMCRWLSTYLDEETYTIEYEPGSKRIVYSYLVQQEETLQPDQFDTNVHPDLRILYKV